MDEPWLATPDSPEEDPNTHTKTDANNNNKASNSSSGGGWSWGGFGSSILASIQTTKEAVGSINWAAEINEFKTQLQSDTTKAVSSQLSKNSGNDPANPDSKASTSSVTSPLSSWIGFLAPSESTEKNEEPRSDIIVDRKAAVISSIQSNIQTFLTDPQDPDWAQWNKTFEVSKFTEMISQVCENDKVRAFQKQLVPHKLSFSQFWSRYFFQIHKLEEKEQRRAVLLERASTTEKDEEELKWDDDDDDGIAKEIEERTKLTQSQQEEMTSSVVSGAVPIHHPETIDLSPPLSPTMTSSPPKKMATSPSPVIATKIFGGELTSSVVENYAASPSPASAIMATSPSSTDPPKSDRSYSSQDLAADWADDKPAKEVKTTATESRDTASTAIITAAPQAPVINTTAPSASAGVTSQPTAASSAQEEKEEEGWESWE